MKKMIIIVLIGLLLLGCTQTGNVTKTTQDGTVITSTAQDCMKTPGMYWCDKEAKCIDPAKEKCA